MGKIELRQWQAQAEITVLNRFMDARGKQFKSFEDKMRQIVSFWEVPPGGGKTLGWLNVADLLKAKYKDINFVDFTPRLILAHQAELDWKDYRPRWHRPPSLGNIEYAPNDRTPLIGDNDGYTTTYASLMTNPALHYKEIARAPTVLICDEAHMLGASWLGIDMGNASSEQIRVLAQHPNVIGIILLSGSSKRADGEPIELATYAEPDASGERHLLYDVRVTYSDGIRDGYLRQFDSHFVDIEYDVTTLGGTHTEKIEDRTVALTTILKRPTTYEKLAQDVAGHLDEHKAVDERFCALIGAVDQSHARKVYQFLKRDRPDLRVAIAVSDDGKAAHDTLHNFKEHKYDVLVTVTMAYIGYNHPWISVVGVLSPYRTEPFLRQFVFRAGRRVYELPYENQHFDIVAPNDKYMLKFIDDLRAEQEKGLQERGKDLIECRLCGMVPARICEREDCPQKKSWPPPPELTVIDNVQIIGERIKGNIPLGDMDGKEAEIFEKIRDKIQLPNVPVTMIKAIVELAKQDDESGTDDTDTIDTDDKPLLSREEADKLRSEIKSLCNKVDKSLFNAHADPTKWGETSRILGRKYGYTDGKNVTVSELRKRKRIVEQWYLKNRID